MTTSAIIGITLLALPLLILAVFIAYATGWRATVFILGGTAVVTGVILLGSYLFVTGMGWDYE